MVSVCHLPCSSSKFQSVAFKSCFHYTYFKEFWSCGQSNNFLDWNLLIDHLYWNCHINMIRYMYFRNNLFTIFHLILLRYEKENPLPLFAHSGRLFENLYSLAYYRGFDESNNTLNIKNRPAVWAVGRSKEIDIYSHIHAQNIINNTFLLTQLGKEQL